jgi:hypothetical protein
MSKAGQQPTAVRDMHTGEEWPSISLAAAAIGVTQGALSIALASHRACKGRWIVAVDEVLCDCCRERIERKKLTPHYQSMLQAEAERATG